MNEATVIGTALRPRSESTLAEKLTAPRSRMRPTTALRWVTYAAIAVSIIALIGIVLYVFVRGVPHLSLNFVFGKYSARSVTIGGAIATTAKVVLLSVITAMPVGVGCAIYLAEYTARGNKLVKLIRAATQTLAGIPSIVFGLFGMIFFVDALGMGLSVWAGSLTLSLMILPTIVSTVEESLLAVPDALREGSFGLGAGKLRTVARVVLPNAFAGIMSALILSVGRVVSESACLMFTSGTSLRAGRTFGSGGGTLAVAVYMLASEGDFNEAFAAGAILIALVAGLNVLASMTARALNRKAR